MRPDVAGTWMFHCHVANHMAGGMMTRYVVRDPVAVATLRATR